VQERIKLPVLYTVKTFQQEKEKKQTYKTIMHQEQNVGMG
jgi:hypothetical protein